MKKWFFKDMWASLTNGAGYRRRSKCGYRNPVVPVCIEAFESRTLLSPLVWSQGPWTVVAPDATSNASFNVQTPNSGALFPGSELRVHYEVATGDAPQFQAILDDGLFRQHAPGTPLLTSFFVSRYFSSGDAAMLNPDLQSALIMGEDVQSGNLQLKLTYSHNSASGDKFLIQASVLIHPPTQFNASMTWDLSIKNVSGHDVTPAWDGHRIFGEQWVAFGASTMYRNDRGVRAGTPAQYIGNLNNGSDYLDDAHSAVQDIFVSPHDTKYVQFDDITVALQPQMQTVVYPDYTWYVGNVADDISATSVRLQHRDDRRRDQLLEVLAVGGLLTDAKQLDWSMQRDQTGPDDVDGDDTLARAGFNAISTFPDAGELTARVRFTSGPPAGFTGSVVVVQSGGSTQVTEGGNTDTIQVALSTHPTSDVTIIVNTDTSQLTAPAQLKFTRQNWDIPQTVTLVAVDDTQPDGNLQVQLRFSATVGSDSIFAVMPTSILNVTVVDDESASPATPIVAGPLGSTSVPTFTWTGGNGNSSEVWLARIAPNQSRLFATQSNVNGRTFTAPEPLPSGLYRFWVRNRNSTGLLSPWSAPVTFEVRPTLLAPMVPTFSQRPEFTWNPVPFASGYEVFVRTKSRDLIASVIATTSWTPNENLDSSAPVRWWIRALGMPANYGWSEAGLTDVSGRTIVLGPLSPTNDRTPTILWQRVLGAGRYILHVQNLDSGAVVIRQERLSGTSFTPSTNLAAGRFRVWVKAIDASTDLLSSGIWSQALDLIIT